MDFDLTEEQRLLKESLDRLIGDRYAFEQRKSYGQAPEGWSREVWAQFAELGLLGLPFAEKYGGSAGGPVETMIAMEAFGRALALEPFLATVVLGGGFLRHGGSADQCAAIIPKIADGSLTLAFAQTERHSRYDLADISTTARRDGTAWVLDGEKGVVLHGDTADKLIVTARVGGSQRDRDGVGVFMVDSKAAGLSRRGYPTQDGLRAAEIVFSGVRVGPEGVLGELGAASPLVERVVDEAIAALCAEAVGTMSAMHELTVDYLKTRRQFGREIGSFQILQHRAVDMLIALEQARSMAMFATMMASEEDAPVRRDALAAAKVQIGRSGRLVGQQAIQLHGGIGMTMEYKVGHYFKRATMIDTMFGDADHHLRELARRGGSVVAA
ncbi:MAG: acyl-CoA dehydrogenase family protein [Alphaproteobacteria bacterium]|nr:acyl-CoA dehydrogenase family protein [Alphaproteobacteria bacterium]